MNSLTSLPPEILLLILEHLDGEDLGNFLTAARGLHCSMVPLSFRERESSRQWWLNFACRRGFAEFARLLLDAGASVNHTFPVIWTAAQIAHLGHPMPGYSALRGLFSTRFDWRLKLPGEEDSFAFPHTQEYRYTPWALALEGGHLEVLKLLHDRGVDFNNLRLNVHAFHHGMNPYWRNDPIQESLNPFYLVRQGLIYEYLRQIGLTPQLCLSQDHHGVDVWHLPAELPRDLLRWMILRDAEPSAIALAIEDGACNAVAAQGDTIPPLVLACELGQVETARLLVQAGESIRSGTTWTDKGELLSARPPRYASPYMGGAEIETGFNSAIWHAFASLRYGPWSLESTELLLELLDIFVEAGLDLNEEVLSSESQAPLLHLAMLPHMDAAVAQKLIENGTDVSRTTGSATFWNSIIASCLYECTEVFGPGSALTSVDASGEPFMLDASHVLEEHTRSLFWAPQSIRLRIRSKNEVPCASHEFDINLRRKTRLLVRSMIEHTATPVKDILRSYLSIYSTRCMVELDAALDLKQAKYKKELMAFQNQITMDHRREDYQAVFLTTSTLYNLRLWVEIFSHHEIDFVGPGLTAVEMVTGLLYPVRTVYGLLGPRRPFYDGWELDKGELSDLVWQKSDVEDSFLEGWSALITESKLNPRHQYMWSAWCTYRDEEKMLERMRDNLQWILKTCFRMDIEAGRGFKWVEDHPTHQLLKHGLVDMHSDFEHELRAMDDKYQLQFQAVSVPLLMELPGWEWDWE